MARKMDFLRLNSMVCLNVIHFYRSPDDFLGGANKVGAIGELSPCRKRIGLLSGFYVIK
ncbi:hypothetical protein SAMN05444487_105102 [Marininema mesophilum]|uniref:Uncharacterized protein n=1 Tax=Marininema mesophilum TaxID=1048340 RepID=A0A1H2VGV4_9BACL|nr:hypothetical protein SAMN05444487_105102 [Marininema mesophilum]